jgi:hypothetical protein
MINDLMQHSPREKVHYIHRKTRTNGDKKEVDFVLVGCKHKFKMMQ